MICPYLNCNGQVADIISVGCCDKCASPVFICQKCAAGNRALARHCRNCNQAIAFPETGLHLGGETPAEIGAPTHRVTINRPFWVSPTVYKGFLWCLSAVGEVMRVSPFEGRAHHFGTLGESFGKSAFTITPRPEDESDGLPPYLLAASPDVLSGINLITGEVREFLRASAGERFLSNFEEGYVGIESHERNIFFLKKRNEVFYLARLDLSTLTTQEYALPEKDVVGPQRIGNSVCVYSRSALYLLSNGEMKEAIRFSSNFTAWALPGENAQLQSRVGRLPFLVRQHAIYIPGASGTVPGFLYVSLGNRGSNMSFFPLTGEASCSQESGGRLLIARDGGVDMYEGLTARSVCLDPQLNPQSPSYYDESLTACFVKTTGGVETLRFYYGKIIRDYSLAQLGGLIAMEFLPVAGTLALPYLSESGNSLGILIWDVR
jgi:hypothetical protein